jgi:uncharacterized protein with PIN domain
VRPGEPALPRRQTGGDVTAQDAARAGSKYVHIRCYEELNEFLPPEWRRTTFALACGAGDTVGDLLGRLGLPLAPVELILVNGESADLSCQPGDGDHISLYPEFESLDITSLLRLRPRPLRVTRFVLDAHLGRLARYCRLLGFDALYRNDYGDAELARISREERRILLTRDRALIRRACVTHGYLVRETAGRRQIAEVLSRFDLYGSLTPLQRCLRCNGTLSETDAPQIADRLPAGIRRTHRQFRQCTGCGRIYWRGSHYRRLERLVAEIRTEGPHTDLAP